MVTDNEAACKHTSNPNPDCGGCGYTSLQYLDDKREKIAWRCRDLLNFGHRPVIQWPGQDGERRVSFSPLKRWVVALRFGLIELHH